MVQVAEASDTKLKSCEWNKILGGFCKQSCRPYTLTPNYLTNSHLFSFVSARQTDPPNFLSAKDLLLKNPYTPTSTLAQAIIQASPLLSELIVVREWLQETAPTPSPPEANTGYWKFTKHTIMQSLRTGNQQRDGLVTEMDPDAVNRGDGATLAADDAVS